MVGLGALDALEGLHVGRLAVGRQDAALALNGHEVARLTFLAPDWTGDQTIWVGWLTEALGAV